MSFPSVPAAFANVRATVRTSVSYPFIELGDTSTKVYTMRCSILRDSYNAAQVSLDATMANATNAGVITLPFAADASAYYCGDFNHNVTDGGMIEFDRVFANIPANRTDKFNGSTAYTFPKVYALFFVPTTFDFTISSVALEGADKVKVTCSASTASLAPSANYSPRIYLTITTNDGVNPDVTHSGYYEVEEQSGSYVIVSLFSFESTFVSGSLTKVPKPTGEKTLTTTAFVDNTFYLPGVTAGITTIDDVPEITVFEITSNGTGNVTNTVSSSGTTPTSWEYEQMRQDGDYMIVKSEIRRYKGNIIERIDTKVRAR